MSAGRYESQFLRAVDPARPRAAWIRHTTLQRPGAAPAESLWCTVWDAAAGPPVAAKVTARLGDHLRGSVPGRAAWDLSVEPAAAPLRHLPEPLYRTPVPRTKLTSPAPAARVSGTVSAGDRTLALDGWPGMTGHNWGAQHAERWIWLHALLLDGEPRGWLDLAAGRLRVAGVTTPWIANGALELDGRRERLGGVRARVAVDARPGSADVTLDSTRIRVTAPLDQTIAWVYADPPGGEHHSLNCSLAAVELEHRGRTLRSAHGGVYELGIRERDHGVPLARFPDP